ncbi:hypothetical protein BH10ACT2_BH10ACT2_00550 [soil metagenome]
MKAALQIRIALGAIARISVVVAIVAGLGIAASASTASASPLSYTGLAPARLLDTRVGGVTIDGQFGGNGPVGPGSVLNLMVLGRGGVPDTNVGAVAINVTATSPTTNSFVTVYPRGAALPTASSLNFKAGQTIANMTIVPVGASGQISLFNKSGQTHLIIDVLGWFRAGAAYEGFASQRLLDTRAGGITIDGQFAGVGSVGPAATLSVMVLGRGEVPASHVAAVAINVTAVSPTTNSYLTVFPSDSSRPTASNSNFSAGQTLANMVIVPVGSDGRINLYNNAGQVNLLIDVLGWFHEGDDYHGFTPARLLDTRDGGTTIDGQYDGDGQAGPASVLNLTVVGRGDVPSSGVGAVAINVTATQPCAASFVSVYPGGGARPTASNLNFSTGQTVANMVIVPVGSDGKISLYNNAGQTDLLVDVLGWFDGSPIAGPAPLAVASAGCPSTFSSVASECTALTNAERSAVGAPALSINVQLNAAAQAHSQYQADNRLMTHDSANGAGPGTRMTNAGYSWRAWGENVAFGQSDCEAVIAAWMHSPGHRTNMLNPAYTNIGIGMAVAANGAKYWTMDLAAPRN